jgi:hypothetical protein
VKIRVFAQVLYVKVIPSCGHLLYRHSRFADFDDIFDFVFGLQIIGFILVVCVL